MIGTIITSVLYGPVKVYWFISTFAAGHSPRGHFRPCSVNDWFRVRFLLSVIVRSGAFLMIQVVISPVPIRIGTVDNIVGADISSVLCFPIEGFGFSSSTTTTGTFLQGHLRP